MFSTGRDVVAQMRWWLIGSAPDFWGRGPGFMLQDHCDKVENLRVESETYT